MLSTIKNYALAALAVAVGLLAAIASWYRAKLATAKLKGEKKAREVERKATDAMVSGLENEQKEINDAKNNPKRDGFE